MSPESPLQFARSFDEFDRITAPSFENYAADQTAGLIDDSEALRYLEHQDLSGGGSEAFLGPLNDHFRITNRCGKFGMPGIGRKTNRKYRLWTTCKKWYCQTCGLIDGIVHKRRRKRAMALWGEINNKSACFQWIFTVPEEDRFRFLTPKGPGALHKMAKTLLKKEFPDTPFIQSFQAFGDKEPEIYKPHIHSVFKAKYGQRLKLPMEKILRVRKKWGQSLRGYGCTHQGEVNVKYNFGIGYEQVMHKIKYLLRPCPGPKNVGLLMNNPELLYFLIVTLSRFKWIRCYGWPKPEINDAELNSEELTGYNKLAGEIIDWKWDVLLVRAEEDMKYRYFDIVVLAPGFEMIKGP